MPYVAKGKCVYKRDTGKKVGCTKGSVKKYLAALHANVNESNGVINNEERFLDDKVLVFDPPIGLEDYLEKLAPILMSMDILWFDGQPLKKGREIGKNIYRSTEGFKYFLFDRKNPNKTYFTQHNWVMSAIESDERLRRYQKKEEDGIHNETAQQFNKSEKIDGWTFVNNFNDMINFDPFDQLNESEGEEFDWVEDILQDEYWVDFDKISEGDYVIYKKGEAIQEPKDGGFWEVVRFKNCLTYNPTNWSTVEVPCVDLQSIKDHKGRRYLTGENISVKKTPKEFNAYPVKFRILDNEDWLRERGWNVPLKESDDKEWFEDVTSHESIVDGILRFKGKEIVIDVGELDSNDMEELYHILKPYVIEGGYDGENNLWWNNGCFNIDNFINSHIGVISLHCGIDDNDFRPVGGLICCLNNIDEALSTLREGDYMVIDGKVLLSPKNINESEEEEFNWAKDIIQGLDKYRNYKTDETLPRDTFLIINGIYDDMEFENQSAKVIGGSENSREHLLVFPKILENEFGETTHCGRDSNREICHCEDYEGSQVGRCWFVNLNHMDDVKVFPNRKVFLGESEDEFEWIEDYTKYLDVGQKFKIKRRGSEGGEFIAQIVSKAHNNVWVSPIDMVSKKYPGTPINVNRLLKLMVNGHWAPIEENINESEEDSELFWVEDLLKGLHESVDITDKLDIMEKLPIGSILQVKGYQDGIEFDMDEVKLIDKTEFGDYNYSSTHYLFKLKNERLSDSEYGFTHCGETSNYHEICECREGTDDLGQTEVGKCWWIELKKQDKVLYYPNRVDLTENKIKKPLLTEGRYDAITRKVVKDIMQLVTQTRNQEDESLYYNLPSDISDDYEYEQDNMSLSVDLYIHHQYLNGKPFEVSTSISNDGDDNIIMMSVAVDPKFEPRIYEKLFYKLQEDIRHEIEHFTQMGPNRIPDRPKSTSKTAELKTTYGHHKNKIEVPALVHGFYRRAKLEKRPLNDVMQDDLDSEIERGNLTKKEAEKLLQIWIDYAKQNLPKAIYRTE